MTDQLDALERDDEFERIGRRAGAELRTPMPADALGSVQRSVHRHRIARTTVASATTVLVLAAGVVGIAHLRQSGPDDRQILTTAPPSPTSPEPTPSTTATIAPTTVAPSAPGTWRVLSYSPVAQDSPLAAVWTGRDAIMLASGPPSNLSPGKVSAMAYNRDTDRWRQLADPPSELGLGLNKNEDLSNWDLQSANRHVLEWTGSKVLAATGHGDVFAYDPASNRWETRAAAPTALQQSPLDTTLVVASRGVLVTSGQHYWWYDNGADRWKDLDAPALGTGHVTLGVLDADHLVATTLVTKALYDSQLTSAVFSIDSSSWRLGPAVKAPDLRPVQIVCDAIAGVLVCYGDKYGYLSGGVIDPLTGSVRTFTLGNHSNLFGSVNIPWLAHAELLNPRTAEWEDIPEFDGAQGFLAGVWTGTEILFFGGSKSDGSPTNTAAAYRPVHNPGSPR